MALIVTIGATNADSYATLAEYQARASAMGWTLEATDEANEINLRRAAVVLDESYAFVGMKQYQFQSRDWPRLVNQLVDGWPINPDTVPEPVKIAQMEMAFIIQGGFDPLATVEAGIKRKREKVDVIEEDIEYAGALTLPRFTAVDRILRDYVRAGAGQIALSRA